MNCPFCDNSKTRVTQTVSWFEAEISRVRICCACNRIFKTVETVDPETATIIKAIKNQKAEAEDIDI